MKTPTTLDEAIEQAIATMDGHNAKDHMYKTIVDFMAQKFGVAYLNADNRPLELFNLKNLYEKLTKRSL
jgi:hypothetical protein